MGLQAIARPAYPKNGFGEREGSVVERVYEAGEPVAVLTTEALGRGMGVLDYRAPERGCGTGDFVEVPLGPRKVLGVVWGDAGGGFDVARLRGVGRVLDAAPMRAELRAFLSRAADYTLTPLPAMLRLATRAPGLGDPPGMRRVYRLGGAVPNQLTDARFRVVEALRDGVPMTLAEVAEAASCGAGVVKGLVKLGVVIEAADELTLARLESVVAEHLNRFAFREGALAFAWTRTAD